MKLGEIRPDTVHHLTEADLVGKSPEEIAIFREWTIAALRNDTNRTLPTIMAELNRVHDLLERCVAMAA